MSCDFPPIFLAKPQSRSPRFCSAASALWRFCVLYAALRLRRVSFYSLSAPSTMTIFPTKASRDPQAAPELEEAQNACA